MDAGRVQPHAISSLGRPCDSGEMYCEGKKYRAVYYHAPIVLLRKGEGRTPKQHRGITILITSYRQASCIWWNRMREPLLEWVHKGACGGLPGTEPTLAAWDAQHDVEQFQ